MSRRWWMLCALLLLLCAALLGYLWQRPLDIELPITNRSKESVQLLFYGEGLAEHVLVRRLPPDASIAVTLPLNGRGQVRIKSLGERAEIDALLVPSNSVLREQHLQFEVRPGNQFLLLPAAD